MELVLSLEFFKKFAVGRQKTLQKTTRLTG